MTSTIARLTQETTRGFGVPVRTRTDLFLYEQRPDILPPKITEVIGSEKASSLLAVKFGDWLHHVQYTVINRLHGALTKHGCFVYRGVLDNKRASQWDLNSILQRNAEHIYRSNRMMIWWSVDNGPFLRLSHYWNESDVEACCNQQNSCGLILILLRRQPIDNDIYIYIYIYIYACIANNKHFRKVKRYLATEKVQEASTGVNLYRVQGKERMCGCLIDEVMTRWYKVTFKVGWPPCDFVHDQS
jgi:hypothetical protein